MNLKTFLKQAKVALIGLGESGSAAASALERAGAQVFISDAKASQKTIDSLKLKNLIDWEQNHTRKILDCNLIIVSPGINLNLEIFQIAKEKNIPIYSEVELAWQLLSAKKIAAITGTNGKTTTAYLLADMCKKQSSKTLLAGNMGQALSRFVLTKNSFDFVVLELSSYQLESTYTFKPDAAACLNLTNDHLARHGTMQNYADAKKRIFQNQTSEDLAVLNANDLYCPSMVEDLKSKVCFFSSTKKLVDGIYYNSQKNKIIFGSNTFDLPLHLPGQHNIENACAAIACALHLGVSNQAISESLANFQGVEHRIEKVKTIKGISFINDSKATNVDSTLKALAALWQPLWLILGGQDKGGSYAAIKEQIELRAKTKAPVCGIFLVGEAAEKIKKELTDVCLIIDAKTISNAVKKASVAAKKGDVVLLSPACASFDQYKNFEERGRDFKTCVCELKDE